MLLIYAGNLVFSQRKKDIQTTRGFVFNPYFTFVEENSVFDDGQSQTGAAEFAGASFVYPIETLEEAVQMLFGYPHAVVGEGEVVILVVFEIAVDGDSGTLSGVRDGVVGEISEYRVEQRVVAVQRHLVVEVSHLYGHITLGKCGLRFVDDLGDNLLQVGVVGVVEVFRLVEAVEHRDVAQQVGEPFRLGIATLHEHLFARFVHLGREDGLHISPDAAHRGLQLVGDILGQLPFQPALLLLLGDVVDGDFEGVVLEDDALDKEGAAPFVEGHRLGDELFAHIGLVEFLRYEIVDFFQIFLFEQIVGRRHRIVGNEAEVLDKEVVGHDYPFVFGEEGQALFGELQVFEQLFLFDRQFLFGTQQVVVDMGKTLGNIADVVDARFDGDVYGLLLFGLLGQLAKGGNRFAQATAEIV